jgi:hypothetical protein
MYNSIDNGRRGDSWVEIKRHAQRLEFRKQVVEFGIVQEFPSTSDGPRHHRADEAELHDAAAEFCDG